MINQLSRDKNFFSVEILQYNDLLESIKFVYGYDFTEYSEASLRRRIDSFMVNRKIETLASLKDMILQNEELFEEFIREISVTVTEMFRDPLFYRSLREHVMPRLATYPFIKVWIALCKQCCAEFFPFRPPALF